LTPTPAAPESQGATDAQGGFPGVGTEVLDTWTFSELSGRASALAFDFGGLPLPVSDDIWADTSRFDSDPTMDQPESDRSSNSFMEALDLQDFWSQFGPGEVSH
jgi:hypothetical protein